MTYAPDTLVAARNVMILHTDLSPLELGIVGDGSHTAKGTSYHLGASALAPGAYSATSSRDRAGLSEAASALDIGQFAEGSANLRSLTAWLFDIWSDRHPLTRDIREIIGTIDGRTVIRVDAEDEWGESPSPGEADSSHLTHTHISMYRDAERRYSLRDLLALYWEEHMAITQSDVDLIVQGVWARRLQQPAQVYDATRPPVAVDGVVTIEPLAASAADATIATLDHAVAAQSLTRDAIARLKDIRDRLDQLASPTVPGTAYTLDQIADAVADRLASRLGNG